MKKLYFSFFRIQFLILVLLYLSKPATAQCPNSQLPGTTAFDTTIVFGAGIVNTHVKFPKFDPSTGMVTCVKLCITIKGVIDTVALENFSSSAQNATYTYSRRDTITGTGIPTYLTSGANDLTYGPFGLGATDHISGSGPDFMSVGPDTVLTKVLCANINDSATISQFYGVNDSVDYDYSINANANGAVTGGSYFSFVLSSALVNFHFSYCTCPSSTLPLDVYQFAVDKQAVNKAQLSWSGFDNLERDYHYEIQLSHSGGNFYTVDTIQKNAISSGYKYIYTSGKSDNTRYYFRIKQVYANGYARFSEVRYIDLENSEAPKINVFPNPSDGLVGIKFVNINSGKYLVQISNTQGQTVFRGEVEASGGIKYVTTLQRGMYWLRLVDVTSRLSCVNQLLIK